MKQKNKGTINKQKTSGSIEQITNFKQTLLTKQRKNKATLYVMIINPMCNNDV